MKIEVYGTAGLVTSASAQIDEDTNQLHLRINTRERWVPHQLSGGRGIFSALAEDGCVRPEHRIIAVEDSSDESACAEVVFLSENETEALLLKGIGFHQQEKDQIHYILISFESLRTRTRILEVGAWRA